MLPTEFSPLFLNNAPFADRAVMDSLHYSLQDCEEYFTFFPDEITARQQIIRDLLNDEPFYQAFCNACDKLDELYELVRNLGNNQTDSAEDLLYALVELLTFTNTANAIDDAYSAAKHLYSERLIAFFESVRRMKEDDEYRALTNWLNELDENMRSIRSITFGANLDAQLNITEVGIVSINNQPFVCGNAFDKVMRNEQPPAEFECISVVGIHEVKQLLQNSRLVINSEFYTSMNILYRSALKNLRKRINASAFGTIRALTAMRGDLHFLLCAVKMLRRQKEFGFPLTFPEIVTETTVENLYNPLLAEKCRIDDIVPSALNFTEMERVFIMTGPNSGGKSVYVGAVGMAQLSFQLGLPICASGRVRMKPYKRIVTHFIEESKRDTESRLANESQRLHKTLHGITEDTLLLLDETFSSTSAYDALFLSESLMRYLSKIGCDVIYVTHLHELPMRLADISSLRHIAPAVYGGRRAYRITTYSGKEETASLAKDIVIENGLGFLFEDDVK